MGRTTDLIDAVVADLQANVQGWPSTYATQSYAEPLTVTPESCPLLAVYVKRLPREQIATDHLYTRKAQLEVAYFASSSIGAETGGALDPEQAEAMLNMIEAIADRCELYADGVPGLATGADGTYAVVTDVEVGEEKGIVWKSYVTLDSWQA